MNNIMDINSINSHVKYPNISHYDVSKPGEMALYLAHCDFYPFRSVIENIKLILDAMSEVYQVTASSAQAAGDHVSEECSMASAGLHASHVNLFSYYSLLLTMVSFLEEAMNTLCHLCHDMYFVSLSLEDNKKEKGIERAATYLQKDVGIRGVKNDPKWEYITAIRDARNAVVHNGRRLKKKDLPKYNKFGIKYHEEDNSLYLEYDDILKMYNAILDFIGRVFRKEPSA